MQKKLKSMPKVAPSRKSFASLLQAALLPSVGALKKASMDLLRAASRHRLKRKPKISLSLAAGNNLTHLIAKFCTQKLTPVLTEGISLTSMAHSYIIKIQERQQQVSVDGTDPTAG